MGKLAREVGHVEFLKEQITQERVEFKNEVQILEETITKQRHIIDQLQQGQTINDNYCTMLESSFNDSLSKQNKFENEGVKLVVDLTAQIDQLEDKLTRTLDELYQLKNSKIYKVVVEPLYKWNDQLSHYNYRFVLIRWTLSIFILSLNYILMPTTYIKIQARRLSLFIQKTFTHVLGENK